MKKRKRGILVASAKPQEAVVFHTKLTESRKLTQQVERMNPLRIQRERI